VADVDVELSVCDRGIGISPAAMERMFWPFFTTKAEALGIGLRLSRTIVEAHGGRIEASNNADGPGATFRVILPGTAPSHHANL
jgi:signal transduction histidine kinase